ncbi:hypothetical protein MED222_06050 [Vibrio sp. MED222]|nr:hypothetical protein MED222_06050 [Vibrio sp. MED222]
MRVIHIATKYISRNIELPQSKHWSSTCFRQSIRNLLISMIHASIQFGIVMTEQNRVISGDTFQKLTGTH